MLCEGQTAMTYSVLGIDTQTGEQVVISQPARHTRDHPYLAGGVIGCHRYDGSSDNNEGAMHYIGLARA